MRRSAIRISESYEISEDQRAALAKADRSYGAVQPAPDELGGYFDFTDWRGQPISRANFLGRWTLLYFGYSRCRGSCQTIAPVMAKTAAVLRRDVAAQAMFVDIEPHPVPPVLRNQAEADHRHASNWPMQFAMAQLYLDFSGKLNVVSGTRAQLAQATAAYHVLREHVQPRRGDHGTRINHSTMLYVIGPDSFVAAYGYHDTSAVELESLIRQLDSASRKPLDKAALKRRYIQGACGDPGLINESNAAQF